ncbi:MAG: SDR family oxidoreductase [Actinobacteria bacterium]|nr:MAG: SDR family oxidoreductase [Actinomycetota bacterium]
MTDTIIPIDDLVSLRGRVAVITGAGSGIGRACALRLAQAGASIVAADVRLDAANDTAARVRASGGPAIAVAVDVRDDAQCRSLADQAMAAVGQIDIVVNGAGIFPPTPIFEMTVDAWDRVLDINARGTFLVSRACATHMSGGAIVNIASKSAIQPTVGLAHYAASKGAVVMLTKALALELAPLRIRVNAIAPGAVDTEGAMATAAAFAESTGVDLSDIKKAYRARNPVGRECEPDEIARVALFLASPLSSYVNGETILTDGGHLLT